MKQLIDFFSSDAFFKAVDVIGSAAFLLIPVALIVNIWMPEEFFFQTFQTLGVIAGAAFIIVNCREEKEE